MGAGRGLRAVPARAGLLPPLPLPTRSGSALRAVRRPPPRLTTGSLGRRRGHLRTGPGGAGRATPVAAPALPSAGWRGGVTSEPPAGYKARRAAAPAGAPAVSKPAGRVEWVGGAALSAATSAPQRRRIRERPPPADGRAVCTVHRLHCAPGTAADHAADADVCTVSGQAAGAARGPAVVS